MWGDQEKMGSVGFQNVALCTVLFKAASLNQASEKQSNRFQSKIILTCPSMRNKVWSLVRILATVLHSEQAIYFQALTLTQHTFSSPILAGYFSFNLYC